ncbi:hypothetical protein ACFQZE_06280 [Paenibacillus sp. GCM10027627]|uniref:hypothetical protein n=1 Tax=unclassified Paenibacillus TaxID=185978 RepID=UPI003639A179
MRKSKSKGKTSAGKKFEEDWKESYSKIPIFYLRLKDSAKWNRGNKSSFTPENPFDALQFQMPFIWLLELKSTSGTGVSFYPKSPDEKPEGTTSQVMIKPNQVKSLLNACDIEGVIAGFVVNFRPRSTKKLKFENETFFIHIRDFMKFAKETGKSGLNRDDCQTIGLRINSRIKKVNYKYDIKKFVKDSSLFCLSRKYISREKLIEVRDEMEELINAYL